MNNNYFIDLYINCLEDKNQIIGYNLYIFDKKLKLLLLSSLFDIEQRFKSVFTNNFAKRYNDKIEELTDSKNYSDNVMVTEIIARVKKQLQDYEISPKEEKIYLTKYGYIPVGAYIKNLSFGLLRDLYYISKPNDKDYIRRQLTTEDISSRNLETILEFLSKIRNICCHNEILFSYISEKNMIPNTRYHDYFIDNKIQYGKRDFLSILICLKLLSNNKDFVILIKNIKKLIDNSYKDLHISKKQLLHLMHLPDNYIMLKKI